jgi:uncharacterized membrane protein YfhO
MKTNTTQDDRIRVLTFLSETHRAEAWHRSAIEWKVVFSTLSLFVLISSAVLSERIKPLSECNKFIVAIFFTVIAIVAVVYLHKLHSRSHRNKRTAEKAEAELVDLIESNCLSLYDPESIGNQRSLWAHWFQALIILFFAMAGCATVLMH